MKFYICSLYKREFEICLKNINHLFNEESIEIETFPYNCGFYSIDNEILTKTASELKETSILFCCKSCKLITLLNNAKNIQYLDSYMTLFINKEFYDEKITESGYFLTFSWMKISLQYIYENDKNKDVIKNYFFKNIKKIIYLDNGEDKYIENLITLSNILGIPYEVKEIDFSYFSTYIMMIYYKNLHQTVLEEDKNYLKLYVEYASIVTFMSELSNYNDINKLTEKLSEILNIIFGIKKVDFIEQKNLFENIIVNEIEIPKQKFIIDKINNSVLIKLEINNRLLGLLKVSDFLFPQYIDSYINTIMDISNVFSLALENIKKQDEIIEAKNKAEDANKAKSKFLAHMSHELRNPLSSIISLSDYLTHLNVNEDVKQIGKMIQEAGMNLLDMVNDLLDLSKIEAGKLELNYYPYDLNQMINEVYNIIKVQTEPKKLNFIKIIDDGVLSEYYGDKIRIKQILINLLGNAVKFTFVGNVELHVQTDQNNLIFIVKDTGIGINEEKKKKLYESFEQGDRNISRKYGGTGLGLAIVKELVDLMKGSIFVESEEEKGTTFRVSLPIIKDY